MTKVSYVFWALGFTFAAAPFAADESPVCQQDVGKFCWPPPKNDPKGILKCLKKHKQDLTQACRDSLKGKDGEESAEAAIEGMQSQEVPAQAAAGSEPPAAEFIPAAPKAKPSWSERHGYKPKEEKAEAKAPEPAPAPKAAQGSAKGIPQAAPRATGANHSTRTLVSQPEHSNKKLADGVESDSGSVSAAGRDSSKKGSLSSSSSSSGASQTVITSGGNSANSTSSETTAPIPASKLFCDFMDAHPSHAGLAPDDIGCGKKIHECKKKFSKSNNPGVDEPTRYGVYVKCIYDTWDDYKNFRCGYNQAKQICQRIRSGKSIDYTPSVTPAAETRPVVTPKIVPIPAASKDPNATGDADRF